MSSTKRRPVSQQSTLPCEVDAAVLPSYTERPLYLEDIKTVETHLQSMDWAFTNDDTRFLSHDIHPYPAKFIPQLPGSIIALLTSRGELVLDPFGGSGTTALEAIRLGRRALSTDANPLSALIGKVKTSKLDSEANSDLLGLHAALAQELENLPTPPTLLHRYSKQVPDIPNREKWFADTACGELALIRFRIGKLISPIANNAATLAMSRMVLRVSFQDSETRYKSIPRLIHKGETIKRFLKELTIIHETLQHSGAHTRYGVADFLTADVRHLDVVGLPPNSVDLVITSPPYGNAYDYHLYHRFRLMWLGFDPAALGKIEIGSHLKHQKQQTGFDDYLSDMLLALQSISRVLKPARFAALVIGDALYKGEMHRTAEELIKRSEELGFDAGFIVERELHQTKRSFGVAARRASSESILFLRKRPADLKVNLNLPPYRLWPYEEQLRVREIKRFCPTSKISKNGTLSLLATPTDLIKLRRLTFTHTVTETLGASFKTWQAVLENGMAQIASCRKDPKYVTHGLHPYKGKFYPQLAKGLINVANLADGATIFDPFCGSGTTLLEGHLNGLRAFGIDMNPLAALVAKAKVGILNVAPEVVSESVTALCGILANPAIEKSDALTEFNPACMEEIQRWFPEPVIAKLNWLLKSIRRVSAGTVRDFLEVIVSSIIRSVSQQDPTDLRVRYRSELLGDADVIGEFKSALDTHFLRLQKFWSVRGHSPVTFNPSTVLRGDSRDLNAIASLGILPNTVDLVLTSPPYATALPYIDTDRLSLLTILGIPGQDRRPLEQNLIGSREILTSQKRELELSIDSGCDLPETITSFLRKLVSSINETDAGFRKQNMPSLLLRFFLDMKAVLQNCQTVLKQGGAAMIVIGDNKMTIGKQEERIPTTDFVQLIAEQLGFITKERIDISVSTENLVHIKNAITENVVLVLEKPPSAVTK